MLRIAIITGSTRPGRNNIAVAQWAYNLAKSRKDAEFELVDIEEYNLPLLDEPMPAASGQYSKEHTKKWSSKIASFDGFIFVTPEYNHGTSAALKNAIDYLYKEWINKVAGFVSYGGTHGSRAVEHLRLVMSNLMIATVREQVMFSLVEDFENYTKFKPSSTMQEKSLNTLIDQVISWGEALKNVRLKTTA